MGQYYLVVNVDKGEFLHPHKLGDGLKLMEFGASGQGTMMALAVLLADGGRDGFSDDPLVGSWAGNRIVITGDYARPGAFLPADVFDSLVLARDTENMPNLYAYAKEHFADISLDIRKVIEGEGESCGARWDT
jgi:hypothetical protein